jgi:glucose uptake protein
MFVPATFAAALIMTVLSAVFWGSWANTFKGTKGYRFELFYWDYAVGIVAISVVLALTMGSTGATGEGFVANLRAADSANLVYALVAGFIFNIANLLLVAGIDIAGLAIAFPISIGIAVVEGVVLSYALQPRGNALYLAAGVALAVAAIICDALAYGSLGSSGQGRRASRKGIIVNVVSGLLMGAFAPFVTKAMTTGHPLTPYSVASLFCLGALVCCFFVNIYFMRRPLVGEPVNFSGFWTASGTNHALGLVGGIIWGLGTSFNFVAANKLGVPIAYAIGQSAPMIAALWGVLVWKEFAGARRKPWVYLTLMFALYVAAVTVIAMAYQA